MNTTNETFYSLDYWFGLYGYPYISDIIEAYAVTPVWLLSLILSIFSLFILLKSPFFGSTFFNYARLYVVNCLILSLLGLTTIMSATHRFFSITNTYEAVQFSNCVSWFAANSLVLFSSCLEMCLVVEKILYLLPKGYSRIKILSLKKFFFILFSICIVINLPSLFLFEPAFADVQLDKNPLYRIWFIGVTSFSYTLTGQILYYLEYLFRDVLPMILKIILNFISVYLLGKYVKNKQRIRATTATSHLVDFDRKQTYIALTMNLFSLLEHLLYIGSYIFYYINSYDLSALVYAVAFLFIAVKHLLFFLIFFFLIICLGKR